MSLWQASIGWGTPEQFRDSRNHPGFQKLPLSRYFILPEISFSDTMALSRNRA